MCLIYVSHNADNIAERIECVVAEYGLTDKIFVITLDNASANTKAMENLTPLICGYVGSLCMHQRCACHIIFPHLEDQFHLPMHLTNALLHTSHIAFLVMFGLVSLA
jgi:hypothetical protein